VSDEVVVTCSVIGGEDEELSWYGRVSGQDIVEAGIAAFDAGAAVLHFHARDGEGRITQSAEAYRAIGDAIVAARPEAILNYSSGGTVGMSHEERLEALEADPDLAAVSIGSFNIGHEPFVNEPAFVERALSAMRERSIKPELEVFDLGHAYVVADLVERGLVDPPPFAQLCLGSAGTAPGTPKTLVDLVGALPAGCVWAAFGYGDDHRRVLATALALGGHVRTGLEDVDEPAESPAAADVRLVERAVLMAELVGRRVVAGDEARQLLGLRTEVRAWPT
jgi:3-keto-5-aminohexanoate cleavage enzyme